MTAPRMPAVFIGHGSPTNTLADNRFTQTWRRLGQAVPRPRAVLVVSAHWYVGVTAVTAMERPRTIHDFFGFPQALAEFEYPAPGAPAVAGEVIEAVKPMWCGPDRDSWGLDHGAWSVLTHLFPEADVPVLQVSINATKASTWHFQLATRLAALREQGVFIVASGNVVHNLGQVNFQMQGEGFDWARRFDADAKAVLTERPEDVVRLEAHADFRRAAPTPDHWLPVITFAGVAAAGGETPQVLVEGCDLGSMSMTAYGIGL